tara:strand:+ start:417 stop:716 length:300 start_codon:yes stop_codon:yes gene_type:complete
MNLFDILKKNKILFLNIFLFLYIIFNFLSGDRGLLGYLEKNKLEKHLTQTKTNLTNKIEILNNKNILLSENLNFDFVDILVRDNLKLGKKEEIIIKIND